MFTSLENDQSSFKYVKVKMHFTYCSSCKCFVQIKFIMIRNSHNNLIMGHTRTILNKYRDK